MARRSLAAGLLTSVLLPPSPAPAAAAPEPVTIPGPGGVALRALLVRPDSGRPGVPVVALHGCGGIGGPGAPLFLPAREADWAARLAALGHHVLFPDSFGSRGLTEVCVGGERGVTPERTRRADAHAAAAWALAQPWAARDRGAVLIGWSHGGSTALAAVGTPVPPGLLAGAVAFYPGCARPGQPPPPWRPVAPALMLLGEADEWTPAAPCRLAAARAAADPEAARVEVAAYPGAHHGFDQPGMAVTTLSGLAVTPTGTGRARMGTDPAAREDALRRVPAFLATLLGRRPIQP